MTSKGHENCPTGKRGRYKWHDVGNSLSSMSEEEGAAEMGEGSDIGNSSSRMSFECEVQNDVDSEEETDVGELLLEEDKH